MSTQLQQLHQEQVLSHRTIPSGISLAPPSTMLTSNRASNPPTPSNPRSTIINKASGSVTGTFHLYDVLRITTIAGSINITLLLQPSLPNSPRTIPELKLSSSTGNITVYTLLSPPSHYHPSTPQTQVPERPYTTAIESRSGNITATLPHSKRTSIHTVSGNISTSLFPLGPTSTPSTIDIRNASGSTQVTLYAHLSRPTAPLRMISSDYHGTTGSLNVVYPLTWQGEIVSKMSKGMVKHQWPGLRVTRAGPRFTAKKGDGVGLAGEIAIHGKGMEVNLMGMDLAVPWAEDEVQRNSMLEVLGVGADGATRPPSYVGYPPSYQECVGQQQQQQQQQQQEQQEEQPDGRVSTVGQALELNDMIRVRHAVDS